MDGFGYHETLSSTVVRGAFMMACERARFDCVYLAFRSRAKAK